MEYTPKDKVACEVCGAEIPAIGVYCPRCGAKRKSMDVSSCTVEPQVNDWSGPAGDLNGVSTVVDNGKDNNLPEEDKAPDVVLPEPPIYTPPKDTRYCTSCGKELKSGAKFCTSCGKRWGTEIVPPAGNRDTGTPVRPRSPKRISFLCMILLIGCAVLWFVAPFFSPNVQRLENLPTAFEIVTGEVSVVGALNKTAAFWVAAVSIAGIVNCLVSEIAAAHGITCFFAAVTEIPLVMAVLDMLDLGADIEYLLKFFGVGFYGLVVLLFLVICVSAVNKLRGR